MRIFLAILFILLTASYAQDIFVLNQRLGRGVNFGNALEAPSEGEWGMTLESSYFDLVKEAGFDSIRLPISWTTHASKEAPYEIDNGFMDRVQWAVDEALSRGLNIIVNIHHYDTLNSDPISEEERYLAIWKQIAEHFKDYPNTVYFELLNEPHDVLSQDDLWNPLLQKALQVIREINPNRAVIVGPTTYNSISALASLELPDDSNLIVTVHFYEPFAFTHQGAEWAGGGGPIGTEWTGGNLRLSPVWQNKSWNTQVGFVHFGFHEAVQVDFQDADAGFYLYNFKASKGYTQIALTTSNDIDLEVSCNKEEDIRFTISALADIETLIDVSKCGNPERLKDIVLFNTSGMAQSFGIRNLEIRGQGKSSISPFDSEKSDITKLFDEAYKWAEQHNRPILLGEFGAYSKGDIASRIRWTSFVRQEAEKRGFSWAYWEFGAGFGVYDREKQQWNTGLLEALVKD